MKPPHRCWGRRRTLATCSTTKTGILAIAMLVGLRIAIGWHFYNEGAAKIQDGNFSSAGFLSQATGPFAGMYRSMAGDDYHGWDEHMEVPVPHQPPTALELARQDKELEEFAAREQLLETQAERLKEIERLEGIENPNEDQEKKVAELKSRETRLADLSKLPRVPSFLPYGDWVDQVAEDWKEMHEALLDSADLSEEQQAEAAQVYARRVQQVSDYLLGIYDVPESPAGDDDDLVKYQHELYRLERMKEAPTSDEVPFHENRIAAKEAEIKAMAAPWKATFRKMEQGYAQDLWNVLDAEQKKDAELPAVASFDDTIDGIVPYFDLVIGALLILGLFTPLASLAGGLFLLSVILSQPPWVSGAEPVYYQTIELFGILAVGALCAGRWAGLDFFICHLWQRCCGSEDKAS